MIHANIDLTVAQYALDTKQVRDSISTINLRYQKSNLIKKTIPNTIECDINMIESDTNTIESDIHTHVATQKHLIIDDGWVCYVIDLYRD